MYSPATAGLVRTGIVGMSGKAYQWEEEMRGSTITMCISHRCGMAEVCSARNELVGREGERNVEDAARIITGRDGRMHTYIQIVSMD